MRRILRLTLFGLALLGASGLAAQPPKPAALKLPDGTVIVFTKSPDEANPLPEGVLLSPAEYKGLLDEVEAARKAREAAKPVAPSSCDIRGRVVARGDRSAALLTLTYTLRTTAPRTVVNLGTARALPTAARLPEGRAPLLSATDDGLTVLLEAAGEQTVTLDVEVPVLPRGAKGDPGFEIGLPRAAITTFALEAPAGVKQVQLGLRTPGDKPAETRWTAEEAAALARKPGERGTPLGPVESLEVNWDAPASPNAPPTEANRAAEVEVTVRVDEAQVETTVKLRLRGGGAEWLLALPAAADLVTERLPAPGGPGAVAPPAVPPAAGGPGLTRPTDAAKPLWVFRPADTAADWLVTATSRQARPKSPDPGHHGPFAVGPAAVPSAARLAGTLRVLAPATVRVSLDKPTAELRRVEWPAAAAGAPRADEEPAALYRFTTVANPGPKPVAVPPLCELTTRPLPGFQRVQPTYTLRRTEAGWRLLAELKVTPVRAEVEEVLVDVPPGWQDVEASAASELIDEVQVVSEAPAGKRLAVRLVGPQRGAFELTLAANFPAANSRRRDELPLPRFPAGRESQARVVASVPEGFEVAGFATAADGTQLPLAPDERAPKAAYPRTVVGATERGFSKVELAWQPYRPELTAESRAEVTWQERQAVVTQTLRFKLAEGDTRPVLISGGAVGLRVLPPTPGTLEPLDRDTWQLRLPPGAPREFTAAFSYALPLPPRKPEAGPARVALALLAPDNVTRLDAQVRVWGGGATRRPARFEGPWRELPPEPSPDRDTLPWLTLAGSAASLPLTVELADGAGALPGTVVERTLVQSWLGDDGVSAVRGRFVLRRWTAAGVDLEVPAGASPEVFVDGRRLDAGSLTPLAPATPAAPGETGDARLLRVPLPEPRLGKPTLLLDVRFAPAPARASRGEVPFPVPRLPNAVNRTPARQQWFLPPDLVPLLADGDATPEQRWTPRAGLLTPSGAVTAAEAEAWIAGGNDLEADPNEAAWAGLTAWPTDTLSARQPDLAAVRLVLLPRAAWFALCSLPLVVLGVVATRLRPVALGLLLTSLGLGVAVGSVWRPQVASQVVLGVQPGVAVLALGYALAGLVHWYYRRRVTHLPGFTRHPGALSTTSLALEPLVESAGSRNGAIASDQILLDGGSARRARGL